MYYSAFKIVALHFHVAMSDHCLYHTLYCITGYGEGTSWSTCSVSYRAVLRIKWIHIQVEIAVEVDEIFPLHHYRRICSCTTGILLFHYCIIIKITYDKNLWVIIYGSGSRTVLSVTGYLAFSVQCKAGCGFKSKWIHCWMWILDRTQGDM
jgi:hypothetical protein